MHVVEYRRLSATIADYFTAQCFAGKTWTILAVKFKHGGRRTCTAGAFASYNWFATKEKVPAAEKVISKKENLGQRNSTGKENTGSLSYFGTRAQTS